LKNENNNEIDFSIADEMMLATTKIQKCGTFLEQIGALFKKRYHTNKRNLRNFIVDIFLPVLLMIIGLSFCRLRVYFE
jgi:hypothetical protein